DPFHREGLFASMFVTIQFPFADVRQFFCGVDSSLHSPSWPDPERDRQFVRYFGPVRKRLLGGAGTEWMGDELYFCYARHALRLPNIPRHVHLSWYRGRRTFPPWGEERAFPPWGVMQRVLRRLFVHQPAMARVEVAFDIDPWHCLTGRMEL